MAEGSVAIVVDPAFGDRLRLAAASEPVWIAHTQPNREEAEKLWRAGIQGITTFVISEPLDPECAAGNILGQVLLHHPEVREIRVIGCLASEGVREKFAREGFEVQEENREGFIARSSTAA